MKELVEVIAKALVDDPESVVVNEREEKKTTVLEVRVAESDMGKVIGKQGRIAKAIRSVVKAAAAKEDKKVIVDIMDEITNGDSHFVPGQARLWSVPLILYGRIICTKEAAGASETQKVKKEYLWKNYYR